jgi:amino acid transporter
MLGQIGGDQSLNAMPDPPAPTPGLKRTMHGFGALMITLSCLSPTIGVFVVGSDVIRQAGTATFLCFVAAALLGVAMSCVYGELVSAFPETGAEYTLMGRTLGPTAGFSVLGLNLTGFTIAQALSGLGITTFLDVVFPGLPAVPVAIALIVTVTAIAILNIQLNALITGAFLALEIFSLVVLCALGFAHPHRGLAATVLHPVTLSHAGALVPTTVAVMGTAAAGAIYAFNGYGAVVFLGEEMHDAPRRVAGVIFWALGLAALFQLAPVLAVLVGAPDLKGLISAPAPLPAFIRSAGGPWLGRAMSLAVALAIFNAMIAVSLMAGRQLYATARDRVWTAGLNKAFAAIHPRFHSPWIATLVMGGVGILWCFAPLAILVTVIAGGTVALYAGLCVAALAGRRNGSTAHGVWRMPLFPLAPVVALAALGGVVWTSLLDEHVGRPGLLATAAIIALSALAYRLLLRPHGTWAHRGPADEEAPSPQRSLRPSGLQRSRISKGR